jgi:murein DD-endopeptidase MepM/ murein hydrolase activator NlpD
VPTLASKNISMKIKNILLIILMALFFLGFLFIVKSSPTKNNQLSNQANSDQPVRSLNKSVEQNNTSVSNNQDISNSGANKPASTPTSGFIAPLDRASERVTKKPFGIYITPETSPVQPERFQGYHTGTDFEIFPEELNVDVPVRAVCDGKLLVARTASGYGGVVVESCQLNNQPITVIYGHLNITSVKFKVGDQIKAGDILAYLGAAYSSQTDGERKHLHLAFHKGGGVNILGYVQNKADLSGWVDPCSIDLVCK